MYGLTVRPKNTYVKVLIILIYCIIIKPGLEYHDKEINYSLNANNCMT